MTIDADRARELEALAEESKPIADRGAICTEDREAGTWKDLVTGTEAAGLREMTDTRFRQKAGKKG